MVRCGTVSLQQLLLTMLGWNIIVKQQRVRADVMLIILIGLGNHAWVDDSVLLASEDPDLAVRNVLSPRVGYKAAAKQWQRQAVPRGCRWRRWQRHSPSQLEEAGVRQGTSSGDRARQVVTEQD